MLKSEAKWIAEELSKILEDNCVFQDRFYDIEGASKYLCIPKGTLYHLSKEIPHAIIGKRLIFSERALRQFVKKRQG